MGFLEYDYFCDAFCVVYDWVDQSLWSDKEFVIAALDNDCDVREYVSEELLSDEEIEKIIEENF